MKNFFADTVEQGNFFADTLDLAPKAEQGDFMRGLGNYIPQMKEMGNAIQTMAGVGAKKIGLDSIGDSMIQGGLDGMAKAKAQQVSKESDSFSDSWSKGIGTVITDWLPYQAGQTVGNIGEGLVTAGAGAVAGAVASGPAAPAGAAGGLVGGILFKSLLKKGVIEAASAMAEKEGEQVARDFLKKEASKLAGLNAGLAIQGVYHGFGETGARVLDEAQKTGLPLDQIDLGRYAASAAGHAALEFIGDKIMIGGLMGEGAYRAAGNGLFPLAKTVAGNVAKVGIKEMPVEAAQSGMERFAAKLPLTGDDAEREYIDSAAAAAAMGMAGAPGGVRAYFDGRQPPSADAPPLLPPVVDPAAERSDSAISGILGRIYQGDTVRQQQAAQAFGADTDLLAKMPSIAEIGTARSVDEAIAAASLALADQADLADLKLSEARDLNTLRAQLGQESSKQAEMGALAAVGAGSFDAIQANNAATIEAPTAMQLAMQAAAQRRATPPDAPPPSGPSSGPPTGPAPRQPDGQADGTRLDGAPFKTLNGAELRIKANGQTDTHESVAVANGFVVRPKTAAPDATTTANNAPAGVQPAASGAPVSPDGTQPVNQPLILSTTGETTLAQTNQAQPQPTQRQEPAAAAASTVEGIAVAKPAAGAAVEATPEGAAPKAVDQRLIPVSQRTAPPGPRIGAIDLTAQPVQGAEVSRYNGKFGKGMGKDAARLEADRLNRTDKTVTYTAEEHDDPKLENPWAVVGRKAAKVVPKPAGSPAAQAEEGLSIEVGGSTIDLSLGKPAWMATPDEVKAAVEKAGFSHQARGKYDPMSQWYEAHAKALAAAAKEGKAIPDEVLYERRGLIRSDLSDDQADIAADAMVGEYQATKDYAKAVRVYRDFGKQPAAEPAPQSAPEVATHKDPGQPAEAATKPVIAEALQKGAEQTNTTRAEMRADLLAKIDAAVKETADYADYAAAIEKAGKEYADSIFIGSGINAGQTAIKGKGSITFDVPGDGTFRVVNTLRGLTKFRAKIEGRSSGFQDKMPGRKALPASTGVSKGSTNQISAVESMLEEGDLQAAMDYMDAVGLSTEGLSKSALRRIEQLETLGDKAQETLYQRIDPKWEYGREGALRQATLVRIVGKDKFSAIVTGFGDEKADDFKPVKILILKNGKKLSEDSSSEFQYALVMAQKEMDKAGAPGTAANKIEPADPVAPATQAATILDAANVTGKDRLDILKDVKTGALTPNEVQAAFPAPVSSREGQMNLANRGGRIALLKAMNEQLRKIDPNEAWTNKNIEDAKDLDALQDKISEALVKANRTPSVESPSVASPLRAELEQMSGAELRAIFEKMNLAGARMTATERVDALMKEDEAEVRAAMTPEQLQAAYPAKEVGLGKAVKRGMTVAQFDAWAKENATRQPEQFAKRVEGVGLFAVTGENKGFKQVPGVVGSRTVPDDTRDMRVVYRLDDGRLVWWHQEDGNAYEVSANDPRLTITMDAPQADRQQSERTVLAGTDDEASVLFAGPIEQMADAEFEHELRMAALTPKQEAAFRALRKPVAPINTENAGAELTYNKRNRIKTGIKWSDIADKDVALRVRETTKANASPRPDYQAMVDAGMQPIIAHLVKQAYDAMAATPNTGARAPTDSDLKGYIEGVQRYMAGVLAWANNSDQTRAWIGSMGRRAGVMASAASGTPTSIASMAQPTTASLYETVYPGGWRTQEVELRLIGGNKALQGLQPSTDAAMKATKEVGKGWPEKQEAWQKQGYSIVSGDEFATDMHVGKDHNKEPYVTVFVRLKKDNRSIDLMQHTVDGATSKDDPDAVAWGAQAVESLKGKHLLLGKYNRLQGAFDTLEAAKEKARELVKRDGKTTVSDKGISVESAEREGVQHRMAGEDIGSDRLQEAFGLTAVNFGNWMLGDANEAERQLHLNHAYDSFMDLAGVLGVPPKALSLNGMLGLAIGAQGTGQYAAHFVPGVNEINLTRTSGAGSLAHEFGHGLDHYFARLAGLDRMADPFLTEHIGGVGADGYIKRAGRKEKAFGEGLRPEIAGAFGEIVQAMNKRPTTEAETALKRRESLKRAERNVTGWLASIRADFERLAVNGVIRDNATRPAPADLLEKFDAMAARVNALELGDGKSMAGVIAMSQPVSDMRDLYKQATGRVYSLDQIKGLQSNVDHLKYLTDAKASTAEHVPQMVTTDYATAAAKLDKDKGGKRYWSTDLEKFARAFDAFISDKLEAAAAKNTYLSHAGRSGETVPMGAERTAINAGIQKLVDTIQTKEDDAGNVAMFARGMSEADALNEISNASDVFSLPKSTSSNIHEITAANMPGLTVKEIKGIPGEQRFHFRFPDGQTARMMVRPYNPYGASTYGFDADSGDMIEVINERPGKGGDQVGEKDDLWIDVSLLKTGEFGQIIYNIAATYAHNTGRIFIGDPAALSDVAMRRRAENMLNSALKFGTTDHLAPHPRQAKGDAAIGVEPLRWIYGDSTGNIARLIDLVRRNAENAGYVGATDYIPAAENGSDQERGRFVDGIGQTLGRDDLGAAAALPGNRAAQAGGRTLARLAVFESLLRRAGIASAEAGGRDGRNGILARLAGILRELEFADPADRIFYARGPQTEQQRLSVQRVQAIVNASKIKADIQVVATPADLPVAAPSDARGLYYNGAIYVVASNNRTAADVHYTIAHEAVGHHGLREMLGDSWKQVMAQINLAVKAGNPAMKSISDYVRRTYVDDDGKFNLNPTQEADEIAAKAVEDGVDPVTGEFKPGFGWLKSVFAKVAQFLRDMGINVKFSNLELQGLLVSAQRNLQRGESGQMAGDVAMAARDGGKFPMNDDPASPDIRFARGVVTGQTIAQAWQAPDPTRMDDFLYSMQDRHIDTKRVVTAVRDAIGGIADNLDPYLQEELYHGRAAMATKEFLEKAIRPLMVDMQARGVEMSDFEEYLHNRHAERRNVQVAKVNPNMLDGGSGIKTADSRSYLTGLTPAKRTAYQALARRVDQMNRETRAMLVSSGLEKQSTIDAWQAAYGDEYVPLMREEMDNGTMGIGQGFSVRGGASKRAMGSDKPVANILANIALQREKAITRAEKRRIGEALYGMVLSAPNPDFWIAVDPALQQNPAQITATAVQLISMGLNPADAQAIAAEPTQRYIDPRTGQVASRINPALRSAENVLAVRIDGEDKYVFFNAQDERAMRMAKALKNLDSDQLGMVMGNVAKVTRYFAAVNTQYNPVFGIVNLTRDIQTALLNLQSTGLAGKQADVMKHVGSALRGIYIDLRDHRAGKTPSSAWANLFEEFQREGGATGFRDMYANAQERADDIADELKKIKQGKAMEFGRGVFGWLSDYNESMENAVRLATYKVAKEQGMSNQQAASLAKNLTVNFNRKGQVALQAGALYAFFNAAVQGSARMAQTMFEPGKVGKLSGLGKKIMTGGLVLGSMQALLLAVAGFDDDEPPDFVRERSIVLPIGGDKYISIPMPLGFHVIPGLARIPTEWAMGGFKDTPKRIGQLVSLFADAFNPIGSAGPSLQTLTPTIIDPLAALAENRDWTGKPIAKKDFNSMQPTAGHTRAKDTATPWSRAIAYGVNWVTGGTDYKPGLASPTPDQIDYLIGQATGGVGREVSKLSQVADSTVSGEELPLYKIPLVGRFVGTTAGQAAESGRFYANLKEIGEHDSELTGLKKDRRMTEYQAYVRDNPQARLVPIAERTYREVSKLNRAKRDALKNGASAERVKLIDQQITARMANFNQRVKAIETRETATQE